MSGLFSPLNASLAALRVRPLKHSVFWILAIGLMLVGSEVSLRHSRTAVIGGLLGLVSGIMALGMAEVPKTRLNDLALRNAMERSQAIQNLSDHLDFCQECNEPSVFCPKGLQLKNIVVELLKK